MCSSTAVNGAVRASGAIRRRGVPRGVRRRFSAAVDPVPASTPSRVSRSSRVRQPASPAVPWHGDHRGSTCSSASSVTATRIGLSATEPDPQHGRSRRPRLGAGVVALHLDTVHGATSAAAIARHCMSACASGLPSAPSTTAGRRPCAGRPRASGSSRSPPLPGARSTTRRSPRRASRRQSPSAGARRPPSRAPGSRPGPRGRSAASAAARSSVLGLRESTGGFSSRGRSRRPDRVERDRSVGERRRGHDDHVGLGLASITGDRCRGAPRAAVYRCRVAQGRPARLPSMARQGAPRWCRP